jgi:3-hydroxyisobutyrate dehydrogenase-like beta-hydroxyacid dehydrogenase
VYCGGAGVFFAAKPGTILPEMSTMSPRLSHVLHQNASTLGVILLDLGISGSTPAVEAGLVTLLAGGDRNTFEQGTPIYESIAKRWFLVKDGSSGIQMKLVVNLPPRRRNAGNRGSSLTGGSSSIEQKCSARCPI